MASPEPAQTKKPVPPYIPYRTLLNLMAGWKLHMPSRIDRSVLGTFSGGAQSAIISALRSLYLIDHDGSPMPVLEELVQAEGAERQRMLKGRLMAAYPFMFAKGFDLTKATPAQIDERFAETGASGDTMSKCLSFFTAMAKDAGIALTPHLKTRQRRAAPHRKKNHKPDANGGKDHQPADTQVIQVTQTPMHVLIELLDPNEMDENEQQAVWTLIRFLKRREGAS